MPDISKITLPSGITYDIKDTTARSAIAGGTSFLGITTTALTDGASTSTIVIDGDNVSAVNGGIAIYQNAEFIYSESDEKWHEIGDTSNLGDLALKDSASASYTPAGTVSQPTFTGSSTTFTGNFTPSGTISVGTGTANYTPAGTISKGTGTANYTPEGSVSTPTITVTPSTTSKYVASSATGGGSVTAGSAASCTLPSMTTSVANETLTIGWSAGSFTANTPTAVTLPSFSQQTIATGISSATSTQPSFTGTGAELKFTGTGANLNFGGTQGSVSVSGTPNGSVSQPTFSGTQATIEVS